jgi:hypothetical protein
VLARAKGRARKTNIEGAAFPPTPPPTRRRRAADAPPTRRPSSPLSLSPSYGDDVGPRIITLKYRRFSSEGDAEIPGAVCGGLVVRVVV